MLSAPTQIGAPKIAEFALYTFISREPRGGVAVGHEEARAPKVNVRGTSRVVTHPRYTPKLLEKLANSDQNQLYFEEI